MRQKNDIDVLIGGTKYTISGYESTDYIMKIATYINDKLSAIRKNTDPRLLDNEIKNVLLQINIADDYYKQIARTAAVTEEKNDADKALFELKHEMIEIQEKLEKLESQNKQLKEDKASEKKNVAETIEEEKKKAAEALEMLEEEKKKAAEALEMLENERQRADDALEKLEEEKNKYDDLEKTVDELLGSTGV